MGGLLRSAHADITLMYSESDVSWAQEFGEDLRIARFRDNTFWFCPLDQVVERMVTTKTKQDTTYRPDPDHEPVGHALPLLEVRMLWEHNQRSWGLENKLLHRQLTDVPPVNRYPPKSEPRTPHIVRGMACALGGKAKAIQTSPD